MTPDRRNQKPRTPKKQSFPIPKPAPSMVAPAKSTLPPPAQAPSKFQDTQSRQPVRHATPQRAQQDRQPVPTSQLPTQRPAQQERPIPSRSGSQHPEQRVGVFVDLQNMYYSAKQLYNAKVNFSAILKEAVKGRKLVRAIAYVIKADNPEEQSFFDVLSTMGYEVKTKELQIFPGGAKKADWDIGIAMDAIELAPKLDTIILVSGDGDFVPLLQHLRRALGCRVEVIAFGKSSSGKLRDEADIFTDLEANVSQYLMQ